MTEQKAVVETYTDGFRTGDLAKIRSCLTDDVVWALHDDKTLVGRDAFAAEADSGDGPNPQPTLDRLIEEGDTVAAVGHVSVALGDGDPVDFGRHCAEIVAQTTLLTAYIDGADLSRPVATCPGWNVSQLLRHVDGGLRWAAEIVASRATSPPPDVALRDLAGFTDEDPKLLSASLSEAAERLAAILTEAGPDVAMWCPVDGGGSTFYARRFTHETAIHRSDAAIALGADYLLDADVAVDAIDEWMELGCLPFHFDVHPWMRELLGPGRTIGLHATDTESDWLLDLTGDMIAWRRSDEPTAAGLRGPATDLLLTIYRRVQVEPHRVEVTVDAELVDFWLERVGFG